MGTTNCLVTSHCLHLLCELQTQKTEPASAGPRRKTEAASAGPRRKTEAMAAGPRRTEAAAAGPRRKTEAGLVVKHGWRCASANLDHILKW